MCEFSYYREIFTKWKTCLKEIEWIVKNRYKFYKLNLNNWTIADIQQSSVILNCNFNKGMFEIGFKSIELDAFRTVYPKFGK